MHEGLDKSFVVYFVVCVVIEAEAMLWPVLWRV